MYRVQEQGRLGFFFFFGLGIISMLKEISWIVIYLKSLALAFVQPVDVKAKQMLVRRPSCDAC